MSLRKSIGRSKVRSMQRDVEVSENMVHGKLFWIWFIRQDEKTQEQVLKGDLDLFSSDKHCVPCAFVILKEIEDK